MFESWFNITGGFIGVGSASISSVVGFVLLLVSGVVTVRGRKEGGLERDIRRTLKPNSDLISEGWNKQELMFRKKLINLLEGKEIDPEKIIYSLDRYKYVEDTNKDIRVKGKELDVYQGKLREGGVEYFTVDMSETFELDIGKGRKQTLPKHIDVQYRNKHVQMNIPWDRFLERNKDVVEYFGLKIC